MRGSVHGHPRRPEDVDQETVEMYRGPDHCGWQGVTFLRLQAPAGQGLGRAARMYIRDPDGLLADQAVAPYDATATLPQGAPGSPATPAMPETFG